MLNVFDVETTVKKGKQIPVYLGAIIKKDLIIFQGEDCVKNFLFEVFSSKRGLTFYAHNFSNFDAFYILAELVEQKIKPERIFVKNGQVIFLKVKYNWRVFNFKDTFLFFNAPLRDIFGAYGRDKEFTFYIKKIKLLVYLVFDVISLYYFVRFLFQVIYRIYLLWFNKFLTIAQLSYKIYKKHFLNSVISTLSSDMRFNLKNSFTSSKIQININYGTNLYFYDVNSMYPYCMKKFLPTDYKETLVDLNISYFYGFVKVKVLTKPKEVNYIYTEEVVLFSEELKYLVKLGYIFEYLDFYSFDRERLFDDFVDHFFLLKRRAKGSVLWGFSAKLIMNSLYGKLGSKFDPDNLIQVAIGILSFSKVEMYQYKNNYFIYADTDSIVLIEKIYPKYLSKKIGMMKLVNFIERGFFIPNYYVYKTKKKYVMKAKGMIKKTWPLGIKEVFNFKLLLSLKRKINIHYISEHMYTFKYNVLVKNKYKKIFFKQGKDYFGNL